MTRKQAFAKVLAASALALGAQFAQAGVVVSLFGDVDPSIDNSGCNSASVTDCYTTGSKSWTQTFTLAGPIVSATVEIGAWQLGLRPPAGVPQLFLDGKLVGALTDTDGCDGSSAPGTEGCAFFYAIDLLTVGALADLVDGKANLSVPTRRASR